MNPYSKVNLKKFIESIPDAEVKKQMKLQDEENRKVYKEFIDKLKKNKCFLCGENIDVFNESKPCFHWFTYPKGIKKKYFNNFLKKPIGFFRLDSYFRWLANSEKPIGNINDLKEETSKTSYIETTYKYKDIVWAFSIGHTDKEGHKNSKWGAIPHYHIQMKIQDRIFLKFNDFHIPFSDEDLFNIELLRQAKDQVKLGYYRGHGIGILENEEILPIIDEALTISENEESATFNRQTIIQATEGNTISTEIIVKAIEESNQTKQPVGKILQKYLSDANFTTIISPGEAVPKMTKRSRKK